MGSWLALNPHGTESLPNSRPLEHAVDGDPLYHYVVVRDDLPNGVRFAQTVHAAGESSRLVPDLPSTTRAVALRASEEAALLQLEARLRDLLIPYAAIREPDAPWCGALMAIGVAPSPRTPKLKKLMSSFQLLR